MLKRLSVTRQLRIGFSPQQWIQLYIPAELRGALLKVNLTASHSPFYDFPFHIIGTVGVCVWILLWIKAGRQKNISIELLIKAER